jgi:hypothetical protein
VTPATEEPEFDLAPQAVLSNEIEIALLALQSMESQNQMRQLSRRLQSSTVPGWECYADGNKGKSIKRYTQQYDASSG